MLRFFHTLYNRYTSFLVGAEKVLFGTSHAGKLNRLGMTIGAIVTAVTVGSVIATVAFTGGMSLPAWAVGLTSATIVFSITSGLLSAMGEYAKKESFSDMEAEYMSEINYLRAKSLTSPRMAERMLREKLSLVADVAKGINTVASGVLPAVRQLGMIGAIIPGPAAIGLFAAGHASSAVHALAEGPAAYNRWQVAREVIKQRQETYRQLSRIVNEARAKRAEEVVNTLFERLKMKEHDNNNIFLRFTLYKLLFAAEPFGTHIAYDALNPERQEDTLRWLTERLTNPDNPLVVAATPTKAENRANTLIEWFNIAPPAKDAAPAIWYKQPREWFRQWVWHNATPEEEKTKMLYRLSSQATKSIDLEKHDFTTPTTRHFPWHCYWNPNKVTTPRGLQILEKMLEKDLRWKNNPVYSQLAEQYAIRVQAALALDANHWLTKFSRPTLEKVIFETLEKRARGNRAYRPTAEEEERLIYQLKEQLAPFVHQKHNGSYALSRHRLAVIDALGGNHPNFDRYTLPYHGRFLPNYHLRQLGERLQGVAQQALAPAGDLTYRSVQNGEALLQQLLLETLRLDINHTYTQRLYQMLVHAVKAYEAEKPFAANAQQLRMLQLHLRQIIEPYCKPKTHFWDRWFPPHLHHQVLDKEMLKASARTTIRKLTAELPAKEQEEQIKQMEKQCSLSGKALEGLASRMLKGYQEYSDALRGHRIAAPQQGKFVGQVERERKVQAVRYAA